MLEKLLLISLCNKLSRLYNYKQGTQLFQVQGRH